MARLRRISWIGWIRSIRWRIPGGLILCAGIVVQPHLLGKWGPKTLGELWEALGGLWRPWESSGRALRGPGRALGGYGGALGELWEVPRDSFEGVCVNYRHPGPRRV